MRKKRRKKRCEKWMEWNGMKITREWKWIDWWWEGCWWCYQGFSCWGLWGFQLEGEWCRTRSCRKAICLRAPHNWNWAPLPASSHHRCSCTHTILLLLVGLVFVSRFQLRPLLGPRSSAKQEEESNLGARHCGWWWSSSSSAEPLLPNRLDETNAHRDWLSLPPSLSLSLSINQSFWDW